MYHFLRPGMHGEDHGKFEMRRDLLKAGQNIGKTNGIINIFSPVGGNKEIIPGFKTQFLKGVHFLLCDPDILLYRIDNSITGYRDFLCGIPSFRRF